MGNTYDTHYKGLEANEVELHDVVDHIDSPVRSTSQIIPGSLISTQQQRRHIWHDTIYDIKHAPWNRIGRRLCSHALPTFMLLVLVATFPVFVLIASYPPWITGGCKPDGNFSLRTNSYNPWKGRLSIDLSFGKFSFRTAKLIDVLWDIVIGRGGQAILAFFSYQAFTKAIIRCMETSPISQDTFKAVTLLNNSGWGILMMLKDFSKNKSVRARFVIFWMLLSGAFILILPTWVSAMTGYTADAQAFVNETSGNMSPMKDFHPIVYTIHDGERIGKTNDFQVTVPWDSDGPVLDDWGYSKSSDGADYGGIFGCRLKEVNATGTYQVDFTTTGEECVWMWRVSQYTAEYGFLGLNTTDSIFQHPNGTVLTFAAQQRSLNISASFYGEEDDWVNYDSDGAGPWDYRPYGWQANITGHSFLTDNPSYYNTITDTTFDYNTIISSRGVCLPTGMIQYRWGFSFVMVFFFIIVLIIWIIGTYAVYLDAYLNSRLEASRRHLGMERALVDLCLVIQKKLDFQDAHLYSNDKIQSLVKGEQITYADLPLDSLPPCRRERLAKWRKAFRFWPWLRAEKWWLMLIVVFFVPWAVGCSFLYTDLVLFWFPGISHVPILGIVGVLVVGRKVRSRWLIFAASLVLFGVLDLVLYFTVFKSQFDYDD